MTISEKLSALTVTAAMLLACSLAVSADEQKADVPKNISQNTQSKSGSYVVSHKQTMTYEQAVKRIPQRTLPEFWMVELEKIENYLSGLKTGKVHNLAKSAGGRNLYVVTYGGEEPTARFANFNSAIGAHEPAVYCDRNLRKKPVILFIGPVHGAEVEGLVGLMNFINIMETGKDLRGKDYQNLKEMGKKCRLVIIPSGNPDGLARFKPKSLCGMGIEDLRFWGQGTWSDNTFCGWPQSKRQHPMKGSNCGFLGCYFNDDGVNVMHDEFFAPMASETTAILGIARQEAPDMAVSLHSSEGVPEVWCPAYVPVEVKQDVQELSEHYVNAIKLRNLPSKKIRMVEEKGKFPPSFNLVSALYHTSGAEAFVFECPQGISGNGFVKFNMEDILEIQLALYQTIIDYELHKKEQM